MNIRHLEPFNISDLRILSAQDFYKGAAESLEKGARAAAYFAIPEAVGYRLILLLVSDIHKSLEVLCTKVDNSFESLARTFPQTQLFEREIAEETGLKCEGHPWLKPVRGLRRGEGFFQVGGTAVHEVAVGPVHAGVIEPGHFRFQCHGERVFHLEIALGYQHRGIERVLAGGPDAKTMHYMETLAGDTTIGHAIAYCHAIETLSGCQPPPRAQLLRAVLLELERLANHTGDLGALSGDVGYLPTAAFCGRLRGDFLNMTALLCGNRFGRNIVRPGGLAINPDAKTLKELLLRLDTASRETASAIGLLWKSPLVLERFEETGLVLRKTALELGLVGPAARASGIKSDTRHNFPVGGYCFRAVYPDAIPESGDVYARAKIRALEIKKSSELIRGFLHALTEGPVYEMPGELKPDSLVVSLNEGWRGEICHIAITDAHGKFRRYKVVDPSFKNWQGLAMAMCGAQISDFPLCNKSFNLSYCGHDL